jgi:hypothetical protein
LILLISTITKKGFHPINIEYVWIYVNTLDKNLGFLLISGTIDNPNINAQGFLPEGEELKAS